MRVAGKTPTRYAAPTRRTTTPPHRMPDRMCARPRPSWVQLSPLARANRRSCGSGDTEPQPGNRQQVEGEVEAHDGGDHDDRPDQGGPAPEWLTETLEGHGGSGAVELHPPIIGDERDRREAPRPHSGRLVTGLTPTERRSASLAHGPLPSGGACGWVTEQRADEVGRAALHCIRCSACLNVCPVYERTGGHAYGGLPGPIGAVLTPQLTGVTGGHDPSGSLPYASSLCGACYDVCPVKINIPDLLVQLRAEHTEAHAETHTLPTPEAAAMRAAALGHGRRRPVRAGGPRRVDRATRHTEGKVWAPLPRP